MCASFIRRATTLCVALLALGCGAVAAAGGNITLSVRNADIAEVFEMLSLEGKANILMNSAVSGDVSVNLYDVSIDQAVRTVAAAGGFAVELDGGTYYIVAYDAVGKDIVGGSTQVRSFRVQYSDSNVVAEILKNHLSRYGKITALPERKLLIVEDLPDFLNRLDHIIAELDQQPTQILIEARILEISLDSSDTYGVDWLKLFDSRDGGGRYGIQGFASTTAPGLFFSLFNSDIEAVLNTLSSKGRVQTLSTPKLLALEHQEAEVVIGEEIGYRVTTTINQISTESVEFLETGVIMRVSSYVDRDGRIMMEIHPEVSTATVTLDGVPSKKSTEVTTQLLANDGETIFIGGLIRNTTSKRRDGVPYISDIPLLGKLFGSGEELLLKTETVVLITPRIVHPQRMAAEDKREKADRLFDELERRTRAADKRLGDNAMGEESPTAPAAPAAPAPAPATDDGDDGGEVAAEFADSHRDAVVPVAVPCEARGPAFAVQDCAPPLSLNVRGLLKGFQ